MGCCPTWDVTCSAMVLGPASSFLAPPLQISSETFSVPNKHPSGDGKRGWGSNADPAGLFPDVLQHAGTFSKPLAKGDTAKQIGRYRSRCLRWGIATIDLGIAVALLFHPALVLVELLCWLITKGAFCCSRGGEDRGDRYPTKKEACH